MRILNDAGVASYGDADIDAGLAADGITMGSLRPDSQKAPGAA